MKKEKYIDDIKEIKEMMERSSRFISLSSYSGVIAGILALLASYLVYITVNSSLTSLDYGTGTFTNDSIKFLLRIAGGVLVLSIGSVLFLTYLRAKKMNLGLWDSQFKRLLMNLSIPLLSGGILCIIFILQGFVGLTLPLTLVFYGLALVNGSKYTLTEIRSLGLIEIVLGLAGTYFIQYGIIFWAFGFGIMHIIYGIFMGLKYER